MEKETAHPKGCAVLILLHSVRPSYQRFCLAAAAAASALPERTSHSNQLRRSARAALAVAASVSGAILVEEVVKQILRVVAAEVVVVSALTLAGIG